MGYLLYSLSFFFLVFVGILYLTQPRWMPLLPSSVSSRLPLYTPVSDGGSFSDDAASGLHSSNFDLSSNIEAGDSRGGLDAKAKNEVQKVMRARGVGFDEARRLVVQERFKQQNIGPDGRPRDPKFVSFS